MPPNQRLERLLQKDGYKLIAGVDEVGVGSLAGPVLAAAVILPQKAKIPGLNDSKKLSAKKREILFKIILKRSIAIGVGIVDWETIDRLNILNASHLAMELAVDALSPAPQFLLIDGRYKIKSSFPQIPLCKGESKCSAIAAASIIAKVSRDKIMMEFDRMFPNYGFSLHKGYGTRRHLNNLYKFGACRIHRQSYLPVKQSRVIHIPLDF
ncbi:MAG: ribonuclease HII [Candidatus Margulisiibacteriota bacterium]